MLQHDIVLDDRHRLRRAEIEIDIAQATDVEAGKDAAGGGFGIEAGHLAGEREQRIVAAALEGAQVRAAHDADRQRHFLQIFRTALCGHDDLVEIVAARGGRGIGCLGEGGGGGQRA